MARELGHKARFARARDYGRLQPNLAVEQQEASMALPAARWCDNVLPTTCLWIIIVHRAGDGSMGSTQTPLRGYAL